jgi:flagellar protein FlaG
MGMQITSHYTGNSTAPVSTQDVPQEKKPPLPGEQKTPVKEAEFPLPVGKKPHIPDLKQTTVELERISLAFDRRLKFVVDQNSREILIKVIDNETDKVIKVLPPEELQRLHSRIKETIGFLFDRMV